jgi:hypothetical protein
MLQEKNKKSGFVLFNIDKSERFRLRLALLKENKTMRDFLRETIRNKLKATEG